MVGLSLIFDSGQWLLSNVLQVVP